MPGRAASSWRCWARRDEITASLQVDPRHGEGTTEELTEFLAALRGVGAVGHRFRAAVLIDDDVRAGIAELTDLAPLHQPRALAGIDAVAARLPGVPAIACFDTAFHAGLPEAAATYALPRAWRERFGLRRYGFHGLSHGYAARRAAQLLGRAGLPRHRGDPGHHRAGGYRDRPPGPRPDLAPGPGGSSGRQDGYRVTAAATGHTRFTRARRASTGRADARRPP